MIGHCVANKNVSRPYLESVMNLKRVNIWLEGGLHSAIRFLKTTWKLCRQFVLNVDAECQDLYETGVRGRDKQTSKITRRFAWQMMKSWLLQKCFSWEFLECVFMMAEIRHSVYCFYLLFFCNMSGFIIITNKVDMLDQYQYARLPYIMDTKLL